MDLYILVSAVAAGTADTALKYAIAIMLVGALMMGIRLDKYHVLIEKVTQAQKKK